MTTHDSPPPLFDSALRSARSGPCRAIEGFTLDRSPNLIAQPKIIGTTLLMSFIVQGFYPKGKGFGNPHYEGTLFTILDNGAQMELFDFPIDDKPLIIAWRQLTRGEHKLDFGLTNDRGTVYFKEWCFKV
jgi:hypothetical protein